MRSYQAARSLFSFLSFVSWALIVVGGIAGLMGGVGALDMMGRNAPSSVFFFGMLPGLALALAGFIGLVLTQIGRAGVDSAEYAQQMLQISRDQLEVSRQTLRQGEAVKTSFEALQAAQPAAPSATYADLKPGSGATPEAVGTPQTAVLPKTIEYKGNEVIALENGFRFSGMEFGTLDAAKSYIDQLGVNPNARLTSPA